ncbi:MAG: type II toxin-antitoxin system VapC family toxin [Gammaproteobacteria bacterium]|nr:type II toxin-antitoxin system VapC family toxin [Gammaproteobacteria bacterium]
MYLIDTNVISEIRKKRGANTGVKRFFDSVLTNEDRLYVSVVTIGELRRGIDLIWHRGDTRQANLLEKWMGIILVEYQDNIIDFDEDTAQLWGKLRAPNPENAIDKQIAATAIIHGLTLVTRNSKDFETTGAKLLNPFRE